MSSETYVRQLLRNERRGRSRLATQRARWRGESARRALLSAAHRGDPETVRLLAGPPPHYLFESMWRNRLLHDHDRADVAADHLQQRTGGRESTTSNLAELVRWPAANLLTPEMRSVVAVAAAFGRHPLAQIAQAKILASGDQDLVDEICQLAGRLPGLAAFCRKHLLAPSDPQYRTLFWLLTVQVELYRATDPDGSIARAAYAEADGSLKYRLMESATEGTLFDLVRSFSGTRVLGDDDELLWRLLAKSTIARAVQLVRQLSDTWQPRQPDQQRLLAAFRSAPAELVTATAADPGLLKLLHLEVAALRVGMGWSHAAAFLQLPGGGHRIDIVSLDDGQVRRQQPVETVGIPHRVVPSGSTAVVWVDDAGLWSAGEDGQVQLSPDTRLRLVATAEGWAAVSSTELLLGTARGRLARSIQLTKLGLRGRRLPGLAVSKASLLLTEPDNHFVLAMDGTLRVAGGPRPIDSYWASADEPLVVPGGTIVAGHEQGSAELRFYDRNQRARDQRAAILETLNYPWNSGNPGLRSRLRLLTPYGDDPCVQLLRAVSEESYYG